ncbi:helix-turn-helix transcriptional regulator [Fictibacillus sp. Mic-4]|uniref:helix-turn-helix domain-containing protein n=1 Tax=Fictibacillus sp. Mic-4 TaxID=3132826 RepID=UPI003CF185E8
MHDGRIIKFYREKAKLTQEQLGRGICSATHISKIERGLTEFSPNLVKLLEERLGISIKQEKYVLSQIKEKLYCWHEAIIMQRSQEIETIKNELDNEPLIVISDYQILYNILQARYYLLHQDDMKAFTIIKKLRKRHKRLPPFERNFLQHVIGIYFLKKQEFQNALEALNAINFNEYQNAEYYFHLAIAYHSNAQHMAYYYAEEALHFFKRSNNFLGIIDAEILILILQQGDSDNNFEERLKRYKLLIKSCDLMSAHAKKARVFHNLAYEYYIRKEYEKASKHYKESMNLKKKNSGKYLMSLEGYLRSLIKGRLKNNDELLELATEGLTIARELKDPLYIYLLTLPLFLIKNEQDQYFHYLSEKALPFFKTYGHTFLAERSERELFDYYSKTGQLHKALSIAQTLIAR